MVSMHWGYKDLFRACRFALSAKKIGMQFVGLIVAGAGYTGLTYIAYAVAGVPAAAAWERFGLLPWLDQYFVSRGVALANLQVWSWLIWALGLLYSIVVALVTSTAVAKVTIEQLRGDDFFEMKEAFRFALSRLRVLLAAPVMPVAFAACIVLAGLLLSLVGAIPVVGDLLLGLFALPAFGAALFAVYLLAVFALSLALVPAIAGTSKHDSFDTLFEVFSCVNEQPWRLVVYGLVVAALSIAGAALLGWFSLQAVHLAARVLGVFANDKTANIASGAGFYLRLSLPSWCPLYRFFEAGSGVVFSGELAAKGISQNLAAVLVGASAYAVLLLVASYGAAIWSTGMTLAFVLLARKKDENNLLEDHETEDLLVEPESPPVPR
jgi:hypothetical protein